MDPKREERSNSLKMLDELPIKFYVSRTGYLTQIINKKEVAENILKN